MVEEVVVKRSPRFRAVLIPGPTYKEFTDEAFGQLYERLEAWLDKNEVNPREWISYFYGDSEEFPEEGRSEACISIDGSCPPTEGIAVEDRPEELVASMTTTLDKVANPEEIYERIFGWIEKNGYTPTGPWFVREIYAVNPWKTAPEDTSVEFQVPVGKQE